MFVERFEGLLEPWAWLSSLGLMLLVVPLLIAAGAAAASFFAAWSGRVSGKVFADKLAKQLAEFGVIVLGLWLLLVLARWGMWAAAWWPAGEKSQGFYRLFFDVPGHLALVSTLASIALVRVWKRSKKSSGAHLALGGFSTVLWLTALFPFAAGALLHHGNALPAAKLSLEEFVAILADPLPWLVWGQAIFLALALGAGFALVYLLARRNKEDYGRDYYGWAIHRCAWWAIVAGIAQAGWTKAVFWREALAHSGRTSLAGADWARDTTLAMLGHAAMPTLVVSLSLALLAWLSLAPVLKTQTPLRMKGFILLHAALVMLSLTALCRMYKELLG